MQEEDYEILRNEANAEPAQYAHWDPSRQFPSEYAALHRNDAPVPGRPEAVPATEEVKEEEEVAAPLSRQTTASSSSSSASSRSAHSAALEEIRTAHSIPARNRATTVTSQSSSGNFLHLHPTERNPEAIRRIETHRSQHAGTVGATQLPSRLSQTLSRRRTEKPLPGLGAGKPFPPSLPDREEYVVEFDGVDDPLHAQNWPMKKKLCIGAILAFDAL
jgi:DHA1 family multidrug resistance protein-like MFS transporter